MSAMEAALAHLHQHGWVRLPGTPALWSRGTRGLMVVLMVLIGIVAVGALIAIPAFASAGGGITAGTVMGSLSVLAMFGLLMWVGVRRYRKQTRFHAVERQDVTMQARGLTVRGVGPIPWADFGPAAHQMVPNEHGEGRIRRAVMPLTDSGLIAVNENLAPELRERISPAMGPVWNRHHQYLYVPGVDGLSQDEVMHLLNTAHQMFSPAVR